jgi:hypothetical protein
MNALTKPSNQAIIDTGKLRAKMTANSAAYNAAKKLRDAVPQAALGVGRNIVDSQMVQQNANDFVTKFPYKNPQYKDKLGAMFPAPGYSKGGAVGLKRGGQPDFRDWMHNKATIGDTEEESPQDALFNEKSNAMQFHGGENSYALQEMERLYPETYRQRVLSGEYDDELPFKKGGKVKLGMVKGPGTETSDSISTLLPNGAFVIPANVDKAYPPKFWDQFASNQTQEKVGVKAKVSNNERIIAPEVVKQYGVDYFNNLVKFVTGSEPPPPDIKNGEVHAAEGVSTKDEKTKMQKLSEMAKSVYNYQPVNSPNNINDLAKIPSMIEDVKKGWYNGQVPQTQPKIAQQTIPSQQVQAQQLLPANPSPQWQTIAQAAEQQPKQPQLAQTPQLQPLRSPQAGVPYGSFEGGKYIPSKNPDIVDLSGGYAPGPQPGFKRKVIGWDDPGPMTESNMQMYTPEYINAVANMNQAQTQNEIGRYGIDYKERELNNSETVYSPGQKVIDALGNQVITNPSIYNKRTGEYKVLGNDEGQQDAMDSQLLNSPRAAELDKLFAKYKDSNEPVPESMNPALTEYLAILEARKRAKKRQQPTQ